jgi:mRNA-degrading endonuclease RelE of RelBE toxin-antitoxin system
MYKLHISTKARRQLKKIAKNIARESVIIALREIRDDPYTGKQLSEELSGRFSYRLGVYRIIYTINAQDMSVNILATDHRATVYF